MKLIVSIFLILIFHFIQVDSAVDSYDIDRGIITITNNGCNLSCVGTLIHSEWIITSAVCALNTFRVEMRILFGNNTTFDTAAHIKNTYIHPEYFDENRENDIALLELAVPADETIRIFKIPRKETSLVAKRARVAKLRYSWGWDNPGTIAIDNITLSRYFYFRDVVVINNELCEKYPVNVNENRLCSIEAIACEGDEGAPLITNERNELVGLVSVSAVQAAICISCNCLMPVTTYTSVVPYRLWIRSVTELNIL